MTPPPTDTCLDYLRGLRQGVLWKVEGVGEAALRRPMTGTGTNLLGLVKHLAACEFGYFQMCFDRPVPDRDFLAPDADMYATEHESAEDILGLYRQAIEASDQSVNDLGLDAVGHVPWWNGREIGMHRAIVHMTVETARHLGHLDIVRELIDGQVGLSQANSNMSTTDRQHWAAQVARLDELADRAAAGTLAHQQSHPGR